MNYPQKLGHLESEAEIVGSKLFDAIEKLSPMKQRAITLRFFNNYLIEEVAGELKLSWDRTDQLIENALKELKRRLLRGGVRSHVINQNKEEA